MLKQPFRIVEKFGGYLKVEQRGTQDHPEVYIELKVTNEAENYFIENMTLTRESTRQLINALTEAIS